MKKESWKLFVSLAVTAEIACLILNRQVAFGYLLGAALSVLLYKRNESFWGDVLDAGSTAGSGQSLHFMINILIMAVPMVLAALYPNVLNIFAVAAGLLMIKITVTVETLLPKKGD